MHYLYIIFSKQLNRFYIGESKNPELRLELHNTRHFKANFTKAASDWKLTLTFECKSKEDDLYLEKFTKKMKSRKFIEKIIENQTILKDILSKK
ncbi:MAG: GIY-YIG nuclease family protein [Flavobacteriaceae bacterium]|nr:GIY-YIG nuclease family protein [Flavobacteriaceae bacterium]